MMNIKLLFFLKGVQIKESTFVPYEGDDIEAEEIEDDVADTNIEDENDVGDKPDV